MPIVPPPELRSLIHETLASLLTENPMATSSESFVQHHVEFKILQEGVAPRYYLRIGINYHGQQVQHVAIDAESGALIGWNPAGEALGSGEKAKLRLSGYTIFPRDENEQLMSDTKVGGGAIPTGQYVRTEFKVRGWLGKTRNLDGAQLEKDVDLLKADKADLLVMCLSEVAHRKWRGEGPHHQVTRRSGVARFAQFLPPPADFVEQSMVTKHFTFERQPWSSSTRRVRGASASPMAGAEHYVTLVWRRDESINSDIAPSQ